MTTVYNMRKLKAPFTLTPDEQILIAISLGYSLYQWKALNDRDRIDRLNSIMDKHGAENVRKVIERLRQLEYSPQFIWFGLLASYLPEKFEQFAKNPPGQVPMDLLRRAAFVVFLIEEKRQTIEELQKKVVDHALQKQIAMNDA